MYDELLFSIYEYINEVKQRGTYWQKDFFEQYVYTVWAANEIFNLLNKNETESAETIIERFARKMDDYACRRKETSRIFSIAHDTAMDILDMVYGTI